MKSYGNFVFISGEKQEKDGNVFCNINCECIEDGDIRRFGTTPEILSSLTKYKSYLLYFDEFEYMKDGKSRTIRRVIGADALK